MLKNLLAFRESHNPEQQMSFLEHLDELRQVLGKIILVLLIATVACFFLRNQLMELLRRPIVEVWQANQKELLIGLPKQLDEALWQDAIKAADVAFTLNKEERKAYFGHWKQQPELPFHAMALHLYRVAKTLPENERGDFVASIAGEKAPLKDQVLALLEMMPNDRAGAYQSFVMMQALNPTEGFTLSLKLALYAGIVVSFPFILYYILSFILPGLRQNERKLLFPVLGAAFILFLSGVLFSYLIVLPRVLHFFHNYSMEMGIHNEWRIGYYITFATRFTLIFGLAFELPVVVMTLVKIGLLNFKAMNGSRNYAILAITVIAAVITPTPDAFTLLLLAVPMYLLYELCIWLSFWLERSKSKKEGDIDSEHLDKLVEKEKKRIKDVESRE